MKNLVLKGFLTQKLCVFKNFGLWFGCLQQQPQMYGMSTVHLSCMKNATCGMSAAKKLLLR